MSLALAKRGVKHRWAEFEGGHEWIPESLAIDALRFFNGKVPPQSAVDSKEERKQAARYDQLTAQFARADLGGKKSMIGTLKKQSAQAADSPERRVARQVLAGAFIGCIEQSRQLMEKKDYLTASHLLEAAVLLRPENANAWYSLAAASAAARNKRRAMEALDQAAANGFRDWERARADSNLAPLVCDRGK
jgi:hypothetical protein